MRFLGDNGIVASCKLNYYARLRYDERRRAAERMRQVCGKRRCLFMNRRCEGAARGQHRHKQSVHIVHIVHVVHVNLKGKAVGWHGSETDTVALAERKLRVTRPRLREHNGKSMLWDRGRGQREPCGSQRAASGARAATTQN